MISIPGVVAPGFDLAKARAPGKRSLRTKYELPLTYVQNPRDYLVNRFGAPAFCWVAGDGNAPTVGPALTATGTPGSIAGPWELEDGTRLPLETYAGAERRSSATAVDPGATDDIVVAALVKLPASGTSVFFGTLGARGWFLYGTATAGIGCYVVGDTTITPAVAGGFGQLALVLVVVNRDGNTSLYNSADTVASAATPAGSLAGAGIGVGDIPGGAYPYIGAVLWTVCWYGAGLAEQWTAARRNELRALATGLEPRANQAPSKGRPVFARASAASWQDDDGRWWLASSGMARAGDPKGARRAPARTNEVYNTINPQSTTGWAVTGGGTTPATLAAVDDAAALATYKAEAWGPNVLKLDNSAGDAAAYAYGGAATGNTTARSYQAIARQTGAGGGQIGSRDASAGTFTSHVAVGAGGAHSRVTAANKVPADVDEQYAIHAPAGTVVYFVTSDRQTGTEVTSPIPNWATAAGAARAAETLDPPVTPRNDRGRVSCGVTPLGFSGAVTGAPSLIARTTGGSILGVSGTADDYTSSDGTTEVAAGAVADGVRAAIVVDWAGTTERITVDGVEATAAYDGAAAGTGTYRTQSTLAETAIDSLVIEEAS